MNIELQTITHGYKENGDLAYDEKVYLANCPDCGYTRAKHIHRQLYTHGIPHEGASVTIDCPSCQYHEWIFLGPDI